MATTIPMSLLAVLLPSAGSVWACDTPVYEYTLVMWQRDPYEVLYFHRGGEDPKDKQTNERLDATMRGIGSKANLVFTRADVAVLEKGEGRRLARQVWEWHKGRTLPFHVVLTPRGTELFVGRLDLTALKSMVQSARRKELAKQLCEGKRGLLLFLAGPEATENAAARTAVRKVIDEAKGEGVEIGLIEVSRTDATEKWLVEQLLQLEDDLKGIQRPMVFGTFGRGHVLEPFVGRGITYENMLDLCAFMNGPCSCEIKAASPGMDLLTDWDWEAHVAGWPIDEELAAAQPAGTAPDSPPAPKPAPPRDAAAAGKSGDQRPARVPGAPVAPAKSKKAVAGQPSAVVAGSEAPSGSGKMAASTPQRSSGGPLLPKSPRLASVETEKGVAAGEEPVTEEEARGPELPPPDVAAGASPVPTGGRLNADLAMGLGLGMGGAAVVAAAVGFLVLLRRREQ